MKLTDEQVRNRDEQRRQLYMAMLWIDDIVGRLPKDADREQLNAAIDRIAETILECPGF